MTSLRQPVGVWHEIVIGGLQARGETSCLSMDFIFSLAFYVWTFYVFCPSPAVNKTVVHITFKCIAWSSCLCLVHSRAVRKPLVATRPIDKTTLRIGYFQFFVRTDHYALVLSPSATRQPTGHGLVGGGGMAPLSLPLCIRHCFGGKKGVKLNFWFCDAQKAHPWTFQPPLLLYQHASLGWVRSTLACQIWHRSVNSTG